MIVFDSCADFWFRWIFAASWQLTLIVLIVAALSHVLQFASISARLRYSLWLIVLVKVFLPPSLTLPIGIGSWGVTPLIAAQPTAQLLINEARLEVGSKNTETGDQATAANLQDRRLASLTSLMLVWISGLFAFCCMTLVRYRSLARTIRLASSVDEGPLRVAFERYCLSLGITTSPELRITKSLTSPCLFGLIRPCVVLPKEFVSRATQSELDTVLMHELVHAQRRDLWIGWLQVVAQSLFWFHPFVWWANRELRNQREQVCDELVLREGGITSQTYGESMIRVLTSAKGRSLAAGNLVGIFERGTNLQTRLEKIMNYKPNERRFGLKSKLAIAVMAGVLLPMSPVEVVSLVAQEAKPAAPKQEKTKYPQIVKTSPEIGAIDVKTSLTELSVTFDRDMRGGMSWTGKAPLSPPIDKTRKAKWINKRTCVLPVELARGKFYRVGINAKSFQNFKSAGGVPVSVNATYLEEVEAISRR